MSFTLASGYWAISDIKLVAYPGYRETGEYPWYHEPGGYFRHHETARCHGTGWHPCCHEKNG